VGARVLFAGTSLMYLVTLVIGFFNLHQGVPDESGDLLFTALFGLGLLVIGAVGTLVAVRRPEHPVGWVLLVGVVLLTLPGLGGEYGVRGLYVHPGLPGAAVGAWLTEWLFVPVLFVMPALLLLLFPDGRVATPRWRVALWTAGGGGALYLVASVLHPAEVEDTLGQVEIRQTFRASKIGVIAGSFVTEGKITRGARVRLVRDGTIVADTTVASLRRFNEDVREVAAGFECGIVLNNFQDVKEGDLLEVYATRQVERELA